MASIKVSCLLELKQYLMPLKAPDNIGQLRLTGPSFPALTHFPATMALPAPMPNPMPLAAAAISSLKCLHIPLDNLTFGVDGALLTGRMQIYWLGQLMGMPRGFVLHADGKHKLHHGEWILMTIGTHHLRWDQKNLRLSTSFVPLVYLFCKQHETEGACLMLARGLEALAFKYDPTDAEGKAIKLVPGACMADHCAAFKTAYETVSILDTHIAMYSLCIGVCADAYCVVSRPDTCIAMYFPCIGVCADAYCVVSRRLCALYCIVSRCVSGLAGVGVCHMLAAYCSQVEGGRVREEDVGAFRRGDRAAAVDSSCALAGDA